MHDVRRSEPHVSVQQWSPPIASPAHRVEELGRVTETVIRHGQVTAKTVTEARASSEQPPRSANQDWARASSAQPTPLSAYEQHSTGANSSNGNGSGTSTQSSQNANPAAAAAAAHSQGGASGHSSSQQVGAVEDDDSDVDFDEF